MTDRREWLISAREAADRKRARLSHQADRTKEALTPTTWKKRAVASMRDSGETAAQTTGDALYRYRWPLAGVATLGLAYVFRRPLSRGVDAALDRLEPLIEDIETGLTDARGAALAAFDRTRDQVSNLWSRDPAPADDTVEATRERVSAAASSAWDRAQDELERAQAEARVRFDAAREAFADATVQAREGLARSADEAVDFVQRRPLTTIASALALGIIAGAWPSQGDQPAPDGNDEATGI